jgi:hypothetical protein
MRALRRKLRNLNADNFPVQIETSSANHIGPVTKHFVPLKPLQDFRSRVMVNVAPSDWDHRITRLNNREELVVGCACASVVCDLEYVRLRLFSRDQAFCPLSASASNNVEVAP